MIVMQIQNMLNRNNMVHPLPLSHSLHSEEVPIPDTTVSGYPRRFRKTPNNSPLRHVTD